MDINEYQTQIRNYVDYPTDIGPFTTILDLSLNVGKLSDKLNKVLVNNHGSFSKEDKLKVAISIGDILNNISNIAYDIGLSMNDIISINLTKYSKKSDEE